MTSYLASIIVVAMVVVVNSIPVDKEQPALSCPANEEYYKCSPIHCYKTCVHLKKQPACPSVSPDCYIPACECIQDYLRNEKGICVPIQQCDETEGAYECIQDYLKNEKGICVPIQQCENWDGTMDTPL